MWMFAIFRLSFLFNCTIPLSLMEGSNTVIYVHKVKTVEREGKCYKIESRIAQVVKVILTLILATLETDWIWSKMKVYAGSLENSDLCLSDLNYRLRGICKWCKILHSIENESFNCQSDFGTLLHFERKFTFALSVILDKVMYLKGSLPKNIKAVNVQSPVQFKNKSTSCNRTGCTQQESDHH